MFLFQNDWPGRPVLPFGKGPSEVSLLLQYVFNQIYWQERITYFKMLVPLVFHLSIDVTNHTWCGVWLEVLVR